MRRAGPFGSRLSRAVSAAIVGSCALVLVSCGSPRYEYLHDDDVGVFLKVPHEWTVFDEDTILDGAGLSPANLEHQKRFGWAVNAAGRVVRQPDGQVAIDLRQPYVKVFVRPLSKDETSGISNAALADAITQLAKVPADQYTLFGSPQTVVLDGGFHGIQRQFELRESNGTYTNHLELVVVDPAPSRIYELSIVCTPECFDQYRDDIVDVYRSWTIKEP